MQFLYKDKNGNVTETYVGQVIQVSSLPTASSSNVDFIYQYTGVTTNDYTHGYFYQCTEDSSTTPSTYSWVQLNVQPGGSGGQTIQVDTMPTASVSELGKIYQFVGITGTYVNGYFYKCVSDGAVSPTYSWAAVKMPADGEWRGTSAEYELVKDNLPNDTMIIIADRTQGNPASGTTNIVTLLESTIAQNQQATVYDLAAPLDQFDLVIISIMSNAGSPWATSWTIPAIKLKRNTILDLPVTNNGSSDYDYGFHSRGSEPNIIWPNKITIQSSNCPASLVYIYGIKF